jgi:ribosomal protein L11 methyltransferase
MAFGTGHHETTRACLSLIHKYFKKSGRFLDFGCGSGVLAILAAKMEASFVKAVDYDVIATQNAEENFKINNIKSNYEIQLGSFEQVVNDKAFDMVCANLSTTDIIENIDKLRLITRDRGCLILSGILETEQAEIENAIKNSRLALLELVHQNEWLTYCLKK